MDLVGPQSYDLSNKWIKNKSLNDICVIQDSFQQMSSIFFETAKSSAKMENCTICVIKPHIVSSGQAGNIMNKLNQNGFNSTAVQTFKLNTKTVNQFYQVYKGVVENYGVLYI